MLPRTPDVGQQTQSILVEQLDRGFHAGHRDGEREAVAAVCGKRYQPHKPKPTRPTLKELFSVEDDPEPPMQDSEGWITPEHDAWERRQNPEKYKGCPTIAEWRQELRASELSHLSQAEQLLARRGRGVRRG